MRQRLPDSISRRALLVALPGVAVGKQAPLVKGICSSAFSPATPLRECFAEAAKAGFGSFEIRLGDQIGPDTPAEELRRVAEAARNNKLTIDSVWVSSRVLPRGLLNSEHEAVRQEAASVIRKGISVAAALDCRCVLLNVARVGLGPKMIMGYRETWERYSKGIRECLEAAEEHGVVLTPENVLNRFLMSPLEAAAFVDQFRSPWVRFHFDIGNVMPGGYPQDWIRILGRRIVRLHAKDVKLRNTGYEFVDLLQGDVDWAGVMAALQEIEFQGSLTCEPEFRQDVTGALRGISKALDLILKGNLP